MRGPSAESRKVVDGAVGAMGKGKTSLPDRWTDYLPLGRRISGTRFIAFKVPLKRTFDWRLAPEERFSPLDLITQVREQKEELGLIIDLTYTTRYYEPAELPDTLQYCKILTVGHEVPDNATVLKFKSTVNKFLQENQHNDTLIGVHCTHGLNRTGYLVCRYLIDVEGIDPNVAIELFNRCRGHSIERKNYISALRKNPQKRELKMSHQQARQLGPALPPQPPPVQQPIPGPAQQQAIGAQVFAGGTPVLPKPPPIFQALQQPVFSAAQPGFQPAAQMFLQPGQRGVSTTSSQIPVLTGQNYNTWRYRMKWCLKKEGVWELIENPPMAPFNQMQNQMNVRAMTLIALSTSPELQVHIENLDNCRDAWLLFENMFRRDTPGNIWAMLRRMMDARCKDKTPITQHINYMRTCFNELEVRGLIIDERIKIYALLNSLGDKWRNFTLSLESMDQNALTLTYVCGRIQDEAKKREQVHANFSSEPKFQQQQHAQKTYTQQVERFYEAKRCFTCGRLGHISKNCFKNKQDASQHAQTRPDFPQKQASFQFNPRQPTGRGKWNQNQTARGRALLVTAEADAGEESSDGEGGGL